MVVKYGLQKWIEWKRRRTQPEVMIKKSDVEDMYSEMKKNPSITGFQYGLKKLKKVI